MQSIIFYVLIIFSLKILIFKIKKREYIDKPLEEKEILMTNIILIFFKFKINLLLLIKLIIFLNFDELDN